MIDESGEKRVRMAHLATVGRHAVNGVAALHSELLKETVLRDFAELWPERFHNVTNGVTPRRFLVLSNPALAAFLDETLGEGWVTDLARLEALEAHAGDAAFRERWRGIKLLEQRTARAADSGTHGHRRRSARAVRHPGQAHPRVQAPASECAARDHALPAPAPKIRNLEIAPRCFVFGGKAAPGYHLAKLMIRLVTGVAEVVNSDPAVAGRIKVVFFPDFNVKTRRTSSIRRPICPSRSRPRARKPLARAT